jgi:hypothetical protein
MARSDLLISLVRASAAGDRTSVTSAVEAMVADERARSHHILADRLQKALQSVPVTTSNRMSRPQSSGRDFIIESEPRLSLPNLILSLPAERLTRQLIEEQTRADLLRAQGLQPRHRVLLAGPPGNGKSSLEHFSIRLGVARVCEISFAFVFGNLFEKRGDCSPKFLDSSRFHFA